jgi:hypothetical protein
MSRIMKQGDRFHLLTQLVLDPLDTGFPGSRNRKYVLIGNRHMTLAAETLVRWML